MLRERDSKLVERGMRQRERERCGWESACEKWGRDEVRKLRAGIHQEMERDKVNE